MAIVEWGLVAFLATALAVALQIRLGAYGAEFGYDECSHYVSGLFIHDYLASGLATPPVKYLRDFSSAYPLVGIGHWGPFWYVIEAFWMFLFGWSRVSVLLFSALTTAVIATILYKMAARPLGRVLAAFCVLAFVSSPITQVSSAAIMLDGAITLLCLLAALAWFGYTRTLQWRYSIAFGLLAAFGLLTKGNAGCLALIPPLFLLLDRNWSLLKRASFWAPVVIVVMIAGPWLAMTYPLVSQGFRFGWGWPYTSVAVAENARILLTAYGPLLLLLAPLGTLPLFQDKRDGMRDLSMVSLALLAAVLFFQCVVPAAIQDRYLEPALPPLMLLAAIGIRKITPYPLPGLGVAGIVIVAALPWTINAEIKKQFDLTEAVTQIWRYRIADNPSVLVVSDGGAEGAAVAEIAMQDPARPSLFAVRGSRLLGGGGYNSQDYRPRFRDPQEVLAAIDHYAIPLVLVRLEPGHDDWAHIAQVEQARALEPQRWQILYRKVTASGSVTLYRLAGNDRQKLDAVQLKQLTGPRSL